MNHGRVQSAKAFQGEICLSRVSPSEGFPQYSKQHQPKKRYKNITGMSKPSRLSRLHSKTPGSKLPSPRREIPTHHVRMSGLNAQTDNTGGFASGTGPSQALKPPHGKGDLDSQTNSRIKLSNSGGATFKQQSGSLKGNLKVTNPEDTEHLNCKQSSGGRPPSSNGSGGRGHGKSSRLAGPRRHTVGGARSSHEILAMQPSEMDKKREAFLEHLKQKYPHHASAIMGHQERLREQGRSSGVGVVGPTQAPALSDQLEQGSLASLDALEVMSECDVPVAFTRGSRSRASLPVVRSANLTKDRSLGVLYLQHGDDTKQIRMPNEITSVDTVRALFVSAFPQQLSMKMLESPSTAIYVKDDMRNMYYELSDVRSITDQSCLKVYHKDPAHAFSHAARPSNGDSRMHRDGMYGNRDTPPLVRQSSGHPLPPTPHSTPPTPHSMPASPSRIPFGPRTSGGGATMPRERPGHPLATPTRSVSPCPSAILERRDVKPDEDIATKNIGRAVEGHYSDPFLLHHHPLPLDALDHGYHRTAVRPYAVSGVPMETPEHPALFRQKSWKTPPASPHRMMEIHASQSQGPMGLERSSPVRQSFRKEIPVAMDKNRGAVGSPVTSDLQSPQGTSNDPQTRERMRAMEEQLASLTGLVQHALLKGPSINGGDRENASDRSLKSGSPVHSTSSTGGSPLLGPRMATVSPDSGHASTPPIHSSPQQVNLHQFRRNVSDLRVQLQQMRKLQLQNQEWVLTQIKQTEQELTAKLTEALRRHEDPAHRQRTLVEDERHKYLTMEENVLTQLGDLEIFVESLKRDPNSVATPRAVTLKEVEEGAMSLRKVGESLAGLKGEFPGLQSRMRAVLRVEVEAVKFLKEEPHKLDSMLKRVRMLTDSLSTLRRYATEGVPKSSSPANPLPQEETKPAMSAEVPDSAIPDPQGSSVRSEDVCPSPVLMQRGSSVSPRQCQQRTPTPELTTKQLKNTEKASIAQPVHTPTSSNTGGGVRRNSSSSSGYDGVTSPSLFIEEIVGQSKGKNRATSIEAAEKEWEERRQNIGHYDGQEFEKMLQEAEANMLRGIPSLEAADKMDSTVTTAALQPPPVEDLAEKAKSFTPPIKEEVLISEKSSKTGWDKAPKASPEKPTKSVSTDRPLKPNLTVKPSMDRAGKPQDKLMKLTQSSEKSNKSPPPPPPRKSGTAPTGMTTTRSGDVVYTSKRESGSSQDGDMEAAGSAPQSKPKISPETKPKPCSPPLITASAKDEEEDEGNKIMAELQHNSKLQENKALLMDENGNNTVRQSPGVIYYVTAQITKEPPDDSADHRAQSSLSQVSHVNASDKSPNQLHASTEGPYAIPNKDPGALHSDPLYKPLSLSSPLKSKKNKKVPGSLKRGEIQAVHPSDTSQIDVQVSINGSFDVSKKGPGMVPIDLHSKKVLGSPTRGKVQVVRVPQVQVSIEEKVESPTSVCTPVSLGPSFFSQTAVDSIESSLTNQKPVLNSSKPRDQRYKEVEDDSETFLSPDLSEEESPPPPPDNIAFMITNTKVQALSTGEYQELVSAKKGNVQTLTVGSKPQLQRDSNCPVDYDTRGLSKKPVIIIFDEPMDIRSAYKRLSTIFECEEELERMLAKERIEEESEENEDEEQNKFGAEVKQKDYRDAVTTQKGVASSHLVGGAETTSDPKHDFKKKFKLKFPKKQLAALSQAIRAGTKTGKKTLQVVVYEDEEETDGTIKQHKETKRFEIACPKEEAPKSDLGTEESQGRTEEIRKNTYKTLDSLEQTIRQLESTISEMGPRSSEEVQAPGNSQSIEAKGYQSKTLVSKPSGSRKRHSIQKKPKPQVLPRPPTIPTAGISVTPAPQHQNASVASTSRMPVPVSAKARQQPGASDRERATKQPKPQDSQRQFRQANGSAKRSGGDPKSTSLAIPASKIPAFSSSTGKGASQTDVTNPLNHSSSSSKSSIPTPRSIPAHSPHLPSFSNGSVKLALPTHNTKGLSLSTQTPNGRPSSSSSSSSPLSPTMLSQGAKSVRTIHTPSFVNYSRPHNGSAGKSAIPTAPVGKEAS